MRQCSVLDEDINNIFKTNIPLSELTGKKIFITGITGLIGSVLTKTILQYNIKNCANIKVYGLARNIKKVEKIFGGNYNSNGLTILQQDILLPIKVADNIDYIIHGASYTNSKDFVDYPVETIEIALKGTENVLKFAKSKQVISMVYLSSLEIYGVTSLTKSSIDELDYGYIDPLNVRSSYSESKRIVECMCASYAKEYSLPIKIARLSQTFGAGVNYNDTRVFAEFARCAIENRNIILHTSGTTYRNYCYITDAISALLFILFKGANGEAYNVANPESGISIIDMANIVAKEIASPPISVEFKLAENLETYGYNSVISTNLNTKKIEQLGWNATVNLHDMFIRLIKSMKELKDV